MKIKIKINKYVLQNEKNAFIYFKLEKIKFERISMWPVLKLKFRLLKVYIHI